MLKKIEIDALRIGMFVHQFCGSWVNHPFWSSSFLLEQSKDFQQIKDSNITELWIDTDKGLDVAIAAVSEEAAPGVHVPQERVLAAAPVQRTSFDEEVNRAAKICAKAKDAVSSMFQEARMGNVLDAQDAMVLVEEISSSVMRNPDALISLARLKTKDDYTFMHSVAVCALMISLARQLKLDDAQVRDAGLAGLLHDVGKMMIPSEVLNKPGKLTDAEFITVKDHPAQGHQLLLNGTGVTEVALDVCLHHHEKMDGTGYPHQLKGEQISLMARMGAVCDVYDAITSNRPYKAGWDASESIRKMAEWSGAHFDPVVFQAFVKSIGIYPAGTLVKLASGRLGIVTEQSEKSLLTPKVKVFFSTKSGGYITPQILDFSAPGTRDKILGREDAEKWGLKNLNEMWLGVAGR